MAFIFVPNSDGSFTEGDKQTNPDTGVEYIYSDGAWRALGAKIEDEFGTLDERYVQVAGDDLEGTLTTNSLIKSTRTSGYSFQVEPEGTDTNVAFIHSNGNGRFAQGTFTDDVEIRGTLALKEDLDITGNTNSEGHFFTKGGSFRIDKVSGNKQFQIYPAGGDNFGANLYSYNNGFIKIRIAEGETQSPYKEFISCTTDSQTVGASTHPVTTSINWLKTPTANHHAANKQYVDDAVGSIVAPSATRPPGLRFKYQSGSGIASSGNFKWYQSGGRRLNISATSQDFDWGTLLPRVDINYSEGHIFTIWLISNGVWKMKTTGTITRVDLHSDHMLCYVSYNADLNGSLVAGTDHYITISGMF